MLFCANCPVHCCVDLDLDHAPGKCPGKTADMEDVIKEYQTEENLLFGRVCSEVSMSKGGAKPRILELIEVCKGCGFHKLGLAFCVGFVEEAKIIDRILRYHGFETESIICKVGALDKSVQGIENGGNAMCNPIAQAKLLNEAKTDFNIAFGLCVGHDSLFFKYSDAPVTVLIAKDKVLAHNPAGALYMADGYYKDLLFPPKEQ